jgi:hypothetical protein
MGILTRQHGEHYVITSDQLPEDSTAKRAPRRNVEICQVWTGARWSADLQEALTFGTLDDADEYVREHIAKVSA